MKRLLLCGIFFLIACVGDAPRDNPLESTKGFRVNGNVHTLYAPHVPLASVPVLLQELKWQVFTDEQGQFEFTAVAPDSYTLILGGQPFSRDTLRFFLNQNLHLNFYLDQLPVLEKIALTTHHQARWFPVEDTYGVQIYLKAADPDGIGDLNQAFFEIPDIAFQDTLVPGPEPGEFFAWRSEAELAVGHINELIGKAFIVTVTDDAGATVRSAPQFLTRVIDQTVQLEAPVGLQTINSDTILFKWQAAYLNFPFHYRLEIFQINRGVLNVVRTLENLNHSQTSVALVHNLPTGDYLWRIYIVDEYGNTSGSREGAFRIP